MEKKVESEGISQSNSNYTDQASPQRIVRQQAQAMKRTHKALHTKYHMNKGLKQTALAKKQSLTHSRNIEIDIPSLELEGQHQKKITMYEELRKYLCEIIDAYDASSGKSAAKIDPNAVEVLKTGLDYTNKWWAFNDKVKNLRLALHGFAYLTEMNVKIDPDIRSTLVRKLQEILSLKAPPMHKNIIEYALMTLSFLIINKVIINPNEFSSELQVGIKKLKEESPSGDIYYPALVVAILAKSMIKESLLTEDELIILQKCAFYADNLSEFNAGSSFFSSVKHEKDYAKDPMLRYRRSPEYYKEHQRWGKGEVRHVVTSLNESNVKDVVAECKYIHAILKAVLSKQKIPKNSREDLLLLLKPRKHHKSEFYSAVLLGTLLKSEQFGKVVPKKFNALTDKLYQMLSRWRRYSLKAYYNDLVKRKNATLKIDVEWKKILGYWSNNDDSIENRKYATLILYKLGDTESLSLLSIEPEHLKSTLIIWLEEIENKTKLAVDIFDKLIKIIDPANHQYDNKVREKEYALYIILSLIEDGNIVDRIKVSEKNKMAEHTIKKYLDSIANTIKNCITSDQTKHVLFGLYLQVLEAYANYNPDSEVFNIDLLKRLVNIFVSSTHEQDFSVTLRVSGLLERLSRQKTQQDFFRIRCLNIKSEFMEAAGVAFSNSAKVDEAKNTFNNTLILIKGLCPFKSSDPTELCEHLSKWAKSYHDVNGTFTILDVVKLVIDQEISSRGTKTNISLQTSINLLSVMISGSQKIAESTLELFKRYILNVSQLPTYFEDEFFHNFNELVFIQNKSLSHYSLYYAIELIVAFTERKILIPHQTLEIINSLVVEEDDFLISRIMDINLVAFAHPKFRYNVRLLQLLQNFQQSDEDELQDSMDCVRSIITASDAPAQLTDFSDKCCGVLIDILMTSNKPLVKQSAINLLSALSDRKLFPKDHIFELSGLIPKVEPHEKKTLLRIILNQINNFKSFYSFTFNKIQGEDSETEFANVIQVNITNELLTDIVVQIMAALQKDGYKPPMSFLNNIANIILTGLNSNTRLISFDILKRSVITELSPKVAEVLKIEKVAEDLRHSPTDVCIEELSNIVKSGNQLTMNLIDAITELLIHGFEELSLSGKSLILHIISLLISQKNIYVIRWVNPLIGLTKPSSSHAQKASSVLASLLIHNSINNLAPYKALVDFILFCTLEDIDENILKALRNNVEVISSLADTYAGEKLIIILFNILKSINDPKSIALRHYALQILKNMNQLSTTKNVEEILNSYLSMSCEYDLVKEIVAYVFNCLKQKQDNKKLAITFTQVCNAHKNHEVFLSSEQNYENRLSSLKELIIYPAFQKSQHLQTTLFSFITQTNCSIESKTLTLQILLNNIDLAEQPQNIANQLLALSNNFSTSESKVSELNKTQDTKLALLAQQLLEKLLTSSSISYEFKQIIISYIRLSDSIDECSYYTRLLSIICKKSSTQASDNYNHLLNFYSSLIESSTEESTMFFEEADESNFFALAPVMIDKIFGLFLSNHLPSSTLQKAMYKTIPTLPLKSKIKILKICFKNAQYEVCKKIYHETILTMGSESVELLGLEVKDLTIDTIKLVALIYKKLHLSAVKEIVDNAVAKLLTSTDLKEQALLLELLLELAIFYMSSFSKSSVLRLLEALNDNTECPKSTFFDSLLHSGDDSANTPPNFTADGYSTKSDVGKLFDPNKGPSFSIETCQGIIKILYLVISQNKNAIEDYRFALIALLRYTFRTHSKSFEGIAQHVFKYTKQTQIWWLLTLHVHNLAQSDLVDEIDLFFTIKSRLMSIFQQYFPGDLFDQIWKRYENVERLGKESTLLLIDNILSKYSREKALYNQIVVLISLLSYDVFNTKLNPLSFVTHFENNIEEFWYESLLQLYPSEASDSSLSLKSAASLVKRVGFDCKTFYSKFIQKIPFDTTCRSDIINLLSFIEKYKVEAHFLTVVMPKTESLEGVSVLDQWLKELQWYVFYSKLLYFVSLITQYNIPVPIYEELINIYDLTNKLVALAMKTKNFSQIVEAMIQFSLEIKKFQSPSDRDHASCESYLEFPNLSRFQFSVDAHLNYDLSTVDFNEKYSDLHQKACRTFLNAKQRDLYRPELYQDFKDMNGEASSALLLKIEPTLSVIGTVKGLSIDGELPINIWTLEQIKVWARRCKGNNEQLSSYTDIQKIAIIKQAVYATSNPNDQINVRDAQLIALLTLIYKGEALGRFLQVATGEGKSILIAIVAIWHVLHGHSVDIITSSPLLAARDAKNSRPLFDCFDIKVAHNDEDPNYVKDVKACYKDDISIVYGSASNFQFDILRHEYSGLNTRGNRQCDIIIIDEVDNLLIDEGSKIAMLANTMPFFSYLNPLFIAIYKKLEEEDQNFHYEQNVLTYFSHEDGSKPRKEKVGDKRLKVSEVMKTYCLKLIDESNPTDYIPIPNHLKQYVKGQLDRWIQSAILAYYVYKQDHHYMIATDSELIDRIAPVDYANTGITQNGTTWGDGLQQFLEIKHGLRLSAESLITNYISNVAFIKRYITFEASGTKPIRNNIYGVTGTLGSEHSKKLLQEIYHIDFFEIPTYAKKQYKSFHPQLCDDKESWLTNIVLDSIREAASERVVLVLCETIIKAKAIAKLIKSYRQDIHIVKYIVSDRNSSVFNENYLPKTIIIATNLAGRGTDIQPHPKVIENGGLHVIFTFLPENLRVERQGFGRTARKGQPGTGSFILNKHDVYEKLMMSSLKDVDKVDLDSLSQILIKRDEQESLVIERIKQNELPIITAKDILFDHYRKLLVELKSVLRTGVVDSLKFWFDTRDYELARDAVEERWGMWLKDIDFSNLNREQAESKFSEFRKCIEADIKDNNVVKNPCYFINLGNEVITDLDKLSIRTIFKLKQPKFHRLALRCYERAIQMDPQFAYIAVYNLSYVQILSQIVDYKSKALKNLKWVLDLLKTHDDLLVKTRKTYSNQQASEIKTDLAMQLDHDAQVSEILKNSVKYAIQAIETQKNYLSLDVKINKSEINYEPLSKTSAESTVKGHASHLFEKPLFDINFHDLHPQHDLGVKSHSELVLSHVDESSTCDLKFDSSKLASQPSPTHSLRKLLPINRVSVPEDPTKKAEEEKKAEDHSTRFVIQTKKIATGALQMPGKLIGAIDYGFQWGVEHIQDWHYGRDRDKDKHIPVTITFDQIPVSAAILLIKDMISFAEKFLAQLAEVDNSASAKYTIDITYGKLTSNQIEGYRDACANNISYRVLQTKDEDSCIHKTLVANSSEDTIPNNPHAVFSFILSSTDPNQILKYLNGRLNEPTMLSMVFNNVLQPIADHVIKTSEVPLTLSFQQLSRKDTITLVQNNDKVISSGLLTINSLDEGSSLKLINNAPESYRDFAALRRYLEIELLDFGFERFDIMPFTQNGYLFIYQTYQKQYIPIRRILLQTGLGAVQIVGGALLAVGAGFTGFGAAVGVVFIAEGISDVLSGIKGAATGQLSLEGYVGNKVFNVGLGVAMAGAGSGIAYLRHIRGLGKVAATTVTTTATVEGSIANAASAALESGLATTATEAAGTTAAAQISNKATFLGNLKAFFTGGNKLLVRKLATQGVTMGARKAVITTATTGIGSGTELAIDKHHTKVTAQMRNLVKSQINSPLTKPYLTKILTYSKMLNSRSMIMDLQQLISAKINRFNFILLTASNESMSIAFENAFSSSCESMAIGLEFRNILEAELKKKSIVLDKKYIDIIIKKLKEKNILRRDEMINIDALLSGIQEDSSKAPDFENYQINFGEYDSSLNKFKNDILLICYDTYMTTESDFFTEKNTLIKKCSGEISNQIMNEMSVASAVGQMLAGIAVSVGYQLLESKISIAIQKRMLDKSAVLNFDMDETFEEYCKKNPAFQKLYEEQMTGQGFENKKVLKMYVINNLVQDDSAKEYLQKLHGEILNNPQFKDVILSKQVILLDDGTAVSRLMGGYWKGESFLNVPSMNENWGNMQWDIASAKNLLDDNFILKFFLDQTQVRYVQNERDILRRNRLDKPAGKFVLVKDSKLNNRLEVEEENFGINVNPSDNNRDPNKKFDNSFWLEFEQTFSEVEDKGLLFGNDESLQKEATEQKSASDYHHIVILAEKAKSQRQNSQQDFLVRDIKYECFLDRITQASLILYRHVNSVHSKNEALLLQTGYGEMLKTWNIRYEEVLLQVEHIIHLLMILIFSNLQHLKKKTDIGDSQEFFMNMKVHVMRCYHRCMMAGYAEKSFTVFIEYLKEYECEYKSVSEYVLKLKTKFDDYHELRYQRHRINVQYTRPALSNILFASMRPEQLDNAIQNMMGCIFGNRSEQLGVMFRESTTSSHNRIIGAVLTTIKFQSEANDHAKRTMENFMGRLIVESQKHDQINQKAIIDNERDVTEIKIEEFRKQADLCLSASDDIIAVLEKEAAQELSHEEAEKIIDDLIRKIDTYKVIIHKYNAILKFIIKNKLPQYDLQVLEHIKARYILMTTLVDTLRDTGKFDLFNNLKNVVTPKNDTSKKNTGSINKKQLKVSDKPQPDADQDLIIRYLDIKYVPKIDFEKVSAFNAAIADTFYDDPIMKEALKVSLLLGHPKSSEILEKSFKKLGQLSPLVILKLDISLEAKSLLLYQTVCQVAYDTHTFTMNDKNMRYLGFNTRLGYSGIFNILGITRSEVCYLLSDALIKKSEKVRDCLASSVKIFLENHIRFGCNFERIFNRADLKMQLTMLSPHIPKEERDAISSKILRLTTLMIIEYMKIEERIKNNPNDVYAWETNQDIEENIKLLENYIEQRTVLEELKALSIEIKAKLRRAANRVIGDNADSRMLRRFDVLLNESFDRPWLGITPELVSAFCNEKGIKIPKKYKVKEPRSYVEIVTDSNLLLNFISNYLSKPYSEIDKGLFDIVIPYYKLSMSFLENPPSNLEDPIPKEDDLVVVHTPQSQTELMLLCKCSKDLVKLYEKLCLPLDAISPKEDKPTHPYYRLRTALNSKKNITVGNNENNSITSQSNTHNQSNSVAANGPEKPHNRSLFRRGFFKHSKDNVVTKVEAANDGAVTQAIIEAICDPNYWYSIEDGIKLLRYMRSRLILRNNNVTDRNFPYHQNTDDIFLADPYHHSNFKDYLNDDIDRILAGGAFSNISRWTKMPVKIHIPILIGMHWIYLRIEINYRNRKVECYWNDPFGKKGIISAYINELEECLHIGCLRLIQADKPSTKYVLSDLQFENHIKKSDQQGYMHNNSDCGVITFANINDELLDQVGSIPAFVSNKHDKAIKRHRKEHARIIATEEALNENETGTLRMKALITAQSNYRDTKLKRTYLSDIDQQIIDKVSLWPAELIDIYFAYVEIYKSVEQAYLKMMEDSHFDDEDTKSPVCN